MSQQCTLRESFRSLISNALAEQGAVSAPALRRTCLSRAGAGREATNTYAWALVDLQRAGTVTSFGPRGAKAYSLVAPPVVDARVGFSISAHLTGTALNALDGEGIDYGDRDTAAIERFGRTVIVLPNAVEAVRAALCLSEIDPDFRQLSAAEVDVAERADAEARRATMDYDDLERIGVIPPRQRSQSGPAHRAWVTVKWWNDLRRQGRFTHVWTVTYEFAGQRLTETRKAVHIREAKQAKSRFVRKLRASHHGVTVVSASVQVLPVSGGQACES